MPVANTIANYIKTCRPMQFKRRQLHILPLVDRELGNLGGRNKKQSPNISEDFQLVSLKGSSHSHIRPGDNHT